MQEYFIYNTLEKTETLVALHGSYHIHLLCRGGEMTFLLGERPQKVSAGDLLIWQMTNEFTGIALSEDFDADVLVVSNHFLSLYNPEQVWATKGCAGRMCAAARSVVLCRKTEPCAKISL